MVLSETHICALIKQSLNASTVTRVASVQSLWSGYGEIIRYRIGQDDEGERRQKSIIAKIIQPPLISTHPRGWNSQISHRRKLFSYQVEANFYRNWASRCRASVLPECLADSAIELADAGRLSIILLSDLDAEGYPLRRQTLTPAESKTCLTWLAHFHAEFMQDSPKEDWCAGLWPTGSYWHLATRPEEFNAMEDSELKSYALLIDKKLNNIRYKTLIHGDAKVANFCFSPDSDRVAALDFQYVGAGCGMKDVVYFLGSCLGEAECQSLYRQLLDHYFTQLNSALSRRHPGINPHCVEQEWRGLFELAWADFQRFLLGWAPQHQKNNGFSRRITQQAITKLKRPETQ